jgi:hypothetical protein
MGMYRRGRFFAHIHLHRLHQIKVGEEDVSIFLMYTQSLKKLERLGFLCRALRLNDEVKDANFF